jgi:xylan 1,4-beta-xylosidase
MRASIRAVVCIFLALATASPLVLAQGAPTEITIDAKAPGHPFPHFWEEMFGSGRAILSLREGYRKDLKEVFMPFFMMR